MIYAFDFSAATGPGLDEENAGRDERTNQTNRRGAAQE